MLQLAPALEGMNLSPCLLGEDIGELEGVRVLLISATWIKDLDTCKNKC